MPCHRPGQHDGGAGTGLGQVALETKPGRDPGVPRVPGPLALGSLGFLDLRPWLGSQCRLAISSAPKWGSWRWGWWKENK